MIYNIGRTVDPDRYLRDCTLNRMQYISVRVISPKKKTCTPTFSSLSSSSRLFHCNPQMNAKTNHGTCVPASEHAQLAYNVGPVRYKLVYKTH